mmetsp:Transcript_22832/g.60307  ORF Transcript_22832/g.60307 Transcript_22832/m.60307 type:complete len:150 (+) Transcript_22832:59-508(+)
MPAPAARAAVMRAALLAGAAVLFAGRCCLSFVLPSLAGSKVAAARSAALPAVGAPGPAREPAVAAASASALLGAAAVASVSVAALAGRRAASGRRQSKVPCKFFFGGGEKKKSSGGSIYDFSAKNIDGADVSLKQYEGKVCLIVNVASK